MKEPVVFVQIHGRTVGPFTLDRAQEMKRRGQITATSRLSADGVSWVDGSSFEPLFPPETPAPRSYSTERPVARSASISPLDEHPCFVHVGGQQLGPMPYTLARDHYWRGDYPPDALLWREGMADWQRLDSLFGQRTLAPANPSNFTPEPLSPNQPTSASAADSILPFTFGMGLFCAVCAGLVGILISQYHPVFGSTLERTAADPWSPALKSLIPAHVIFFAVIGLIMGCALGAFLGSVAKNDSQ
jgi:hypothetical protein